MIKLQHLSTALAAAVISCLSFSVAEAEPLELGWSAVKLSIALTQISTNGTLKYAWAKGEATDSTCGSITVNGVTFKTTWKLDDPCQEFKDAGNFSISPNFTKNNTNWGSYGATGDNAKMLNSGWYDKTAGTYTYTLNGLESGKSYLVQLIAQKQGSYPSSATSPDGTATIYFSGSEYAIGGALVGVFTATGTSYSFDITYTGTYQVLNAIQVREVEVAGPTITDPSVGSTTATPSGKTVTIALSDVVMGTDDSGAAATKYSVYYTLDGGETETALTDQTGTSAQFDISDLSEGDHSCSVWITTDKEKSTEAQSVEFTIDTTPISPSIGTPTASVVSRTATITLPDIVKGTDDDGMPASKYTVYYKLGELGETVTALTDQSGTSVEFSITDLATASYTCYVWITTDKSKTTEAKSVDFEIVVTIFDTLKETIEAAAEGATVNVAAGTYNATSAITIPNKNIQIVAADPANTIFDGGYPTLSNSLFSVSKEGVLIAGITFQNTGKPAIAQSSSPYGLVISNCVFKDCHAENGAGINGNLNYGEHDAQSTTVFPARGDMGVISDCVFTNCAAYGTSAVDGAGAVSGPFWIENSTFDDCSSVKGAPVFFANHNMMITNCVFKNCPKGGRPAIYMNRNTTMKMLDCGFENMTCSALVGCYSGGNILVDRCDIGNCAGAETLTGDSTVYAIFSTAGVIRNSLIHGNKNPFNLIGESYQNCTIVDNVGGLFIKFRNGGSGPSSSFTNCVFANNTKWDATSYTGGGAGLQWHGASADANVYKNLLFGNCVLQGAASSANGLNVLLAQDSTGNTTNLTAYADTNGIGFKGDGGDYKYMPMSNSVLVGNGAVATDWMSGALDLAGNPRLSSGKVAIGCYEHAGADPSVSLCSGISAYDYGSGVWQITGSGALTSASAIADKSVAKIVIGDGVTSIGEGVFSGWRTLRDVTIGDDVTSIGNNAFKKSSFITNVVVGTGLSTVGNSAFAYCMSLQKVEFQSDEPEMGTDALVLHAGIRKDGDNWVVYPIPEVTFNGDSPKLYGTASLSTPSWQEVTDSNTANFSFFTYTDMSAK